MWFIAREIVSEPLISICGYACEADIHHIHTEKLQLGDRLMRMIFKECGQPEIVGRIVFPQVVWIAPPRLPYNLNGERRAGVLDLLLRLREVALTCKRRRICTFAGRRRSSSSGQRGSSSSGRRGSSSSGRMWDRAFDTRCEGAPFVVERIALRVVTLLDVVSVAGEYVIQRGAVRCRGHCGKR